jgi:hypothetical protein
MHWTVYMILRCLYIDTPEPSFLSLEPGYHASFVSADELARYVARPEYELTDRFVSRELALGHECFAIRTDQTLAAYGWYATTPTHFTDDLSVHFDRPWVYMYKGFTHPAFRGRRLHAIGMTLALTLYRARGFRGLVSIVTADNAASLASCARMGYRRFGSIYTMRPGRILGLARPRWLNHVFMIASPGCKAFGFRLERSPVSPPPAAVRVAAPAAAAAEVSRIP